MRANYLIIIFSLIVFAVIIPSFNASASDTFLISVSSGGGITASHNITSIDQDGFIYSKVVSFVLKENNKEEEIIGMISTNEAIKFYSRLQYINFNKIKYSKPGNWCFALSLTDNTGEHSVAWSDEPEIDEIKPVIDIYNEILEIAKNERRTYKNKK